MKKQKEEQGVPPSGSVSASKSSPITAPGFPATPSRAAAEAETSAHTPGPWVIDPTQPSRVLGQGPRKQYTVVVAECPGYQAPREANAKLIAKSPDLRAALQAIVDELREYGFIGVQGVPQSYEESHWSWSPSIQAAQKLLATL